MEHAPTFNFTLPEVTPPSSPPQEPTGSKRKAREVIDIEVTSNSTQSTYSAMGHLVPTGRHDTRRRNARKRRKLAGEVSEEVMQEYERWKEHFSHVHVGVYEGDLLSRGLNRRRPPVYVRGFAAPNPILQEFLDDVQPDLHGVDLSGHCFMTSNLQAQMDHLKHYDYEPTIPSPRVQSDYELAASLVDKMLSGWDLLQFPEEDDIDGVSFHKDRFPGWEYRAEGYKTRGAAADAARIDAKRTFRALMEGQDVRPHFVRMGGRGKPVPKSQAEAEAEKLVKGRLILMTSSRDFYVCGVTEQPLNDLFKDKDCFISVGDSWYLGGSHDSYLRYTGYDKYYCFDAKKFDSSIPPYMIKRAILTLRDRFEDGRHERYDTYWDFVERTMFETEILRDDGLIFTKHTGTTSGHNHNSIVQSIISATLFFYALVQLNPELTGSELVRNTAIKTLGDDTLPATRAPIAPTHYRTIANLIWDDLHIDWRGEKSYATNSYLDLDLDDPKFTEKDRFLSVQYLGKYFALTEYVTEDGTYDRCIPYRPFAETLIRLFYPERAIDANKYTREEIGAIYYQRALGHLLDGYGNPWTRVFLDRYLDWMEERDFNRVTQWDEDAEAKFMMDYGAAREPLTIVPRRYNYDEWLDLVILPKKVVVSSFSLDTYMEEVLNEGSNPVEST
uniref:RNA-dependent RNA polymerase n=1 Tax=Rhizoctonia cerealis orthocurvulavirus TaxID=3068670 RepID=A0AA51BS53_9VIRU|nr:MAG: RNA-dependent RNA polymerase [Rhizoctonia cerealis orthocurvulavirus]